MYPVTLYTKSYCVLSKRAFALLDEKGVSYEVVDVTDEGPRFTEMAKRAHGALTTPQIFIGGQHIGGCADLERLDPAGKPVEAGGLRGTTPPQPF